MAQLIVRQFDDGLVEKLKQQAREHHVSMEEEHRQILKKALSSKRSKDSFKNALLAMPDLGMDSIFDRMPQPSRSISL
jgi:antitoxin FitA